MVDENIVQLPTRLERLAGKLKDYLGRDITNREEWIEIQEGICLTLAEARDEFAADIEFGRWCDDNVKMNRDDRAAGISMGREPTALHDCLRATTRRSLQMIYRYEFDRFRSATKPPKKRHKEKKETTKPSAQMQKAMNAYEELEAKGEPITAKAVGELAGVSDTPVRRVFALKNEEARLKPLTPAEMRETDKKRFDLAVKRVRQEIREELRQEVYKECDVFVSHIKERAERAERILANFRGVMSKEDFRKIKACLHPDHNTFKYAAEALQIFGELEGVLVKPDPPKFSGPPLPSTAAELMARRRTR